MGGFLLAPLLSPTVHAQACIGVCSVGAGVCAADLACGGGETCIGACSAPASAPATSAFTPVSCEDPTLMPSADSCTDEARDHRNIVGGGADPALSFAQDGTYLYLRVRLEQDPAMSGALRAFAWGFGLDADADGEFEAYITAIGQGGADRVEVRDQDPDNGIEQDFVLAGGGPDTALYPVVTDMSEPSWVFVTDAPGGNFCADDTDLNDFHLTVAIPLTLLADFGALGAVVAYAGTSSSFTGIQNDLVCADGTASCSVGADCPSGICLASGICGPEVPPVFTGCIDEDPDGDGIDTGCNTGMPHCVIDGGTSVCVECVSAGECDDSDPCTADACTAAACTTSPSPAGTLCAGGVCDGAAAPACVVCVDDAPGTEQDSGCTAGAPVCDESGPSPVCTGCTSATDCDDGVECTEDSCSAMICSNVPKPIGTMCATGFCDGAAMGPSCEACVDDAGPGATDTGLHGGDAALRYVGCRAGLHRLPRRNRLRRRRGVHRGRMHRWGVFRDGGARGSSLRGRRVRR